jgi:hypothetical protein
MYNTSSKRPLSTGMTETLMEIHEREIMGQDLCGQEARNIAGLFKRGLINMKHCISRLGKPYMGFYVTESGKQYLQKSIKKPENFRA